jgi:hypothetical protein
MPIGRPIKNNLCYTVPASSSASFFILRAALTTFPFVIIPTFRNGNAISQESGYQAEADEQSGENMDPLTSLPVLSTTGNLLYLVSSSSLVAASRLVLSRTTIGDVLITSPMTLPLVLLNSLCISRNVCRAVI